MAETLEEALRRLEGEPENRGPWHVLWVMSTYRRTNLLYVPHKRRVSECLAEGYLTLNEARTEVRTNLLHARCDAWLLNVETGEAEHQPRKYSRDHCDGG